MTRSTISVSVSRARFEGMVGDLAREQGADLVLSAPGWPAQTAPVIGLRPVAELVISRDTAPEAIKEFCFGTPGPALGFVSYDYGMLLRGVASGREPQGPLGHLKKYAAWLEYDEEAGCAVVTADEPGLRDGLAYRLETAFEGLESGPVAGLPLGSPEASLSRAGYEAGVRETLARIRTGHTYQLNLSTRFSWRCPGLDPLGLFLSLWCSHPAPFYVWFSSGDRRLISTSPERFLRVEAGRVLSQPIKGTLRFDEYAPELEARLTESPKECAELSMIVDLIRNDIAANCAYGSVRVENHRSVFAVDNLLQMYADVRGELRPDRDCLDLFLDAFPGGSITGCPKLSSMRIIEELEPHAREAYCGSAVVVRGERDLDSSILIRTAVFDTTSGRLDAYAGSGIVVDSNPANEYQETVAKAEKFLITGAE